jgi:hypothetical protein
MNEALVSLQKAIYETLNNDVTMSAMVNGVHDFVPEGTEFPYVVIEPGKTKDWSTVSTVGYEVELMVMAYSNQPGSKPVLEIADQLHHLLNNAELTLDGGHRAVDIRFRNGEVKRSKNESVYVAMSSFIAFVEMV